MGDGWVFMNNMEKDGYSFEFLLEDFKKEYIELFKDPYNLSPLQAASFFNDQFDILRLKYPGFEETLEIILADLLISYSCYSSRLHPSALTIIDNNLLPELWRKNGVSEDLVVKRSQFLIQLRENIKEIQ
jgi:hypothetical protein